MGRISDSKLLVATGSAIITAAILAIYRRRGKAKKYAVPPALLASAYAKELRVAMALARHAGNNMFRYCDEKGTELEQDHDLGIETKGQAEDFCTKIDVENETLVTQGLLRHFPDHKIIGEEAVGQGVIPPLTKDPTWIIDPIDGTTNFASGLPLTCVSIGLCVNQTPTVGVVYVPMTEELYVAVKGYGAYRNGVRLSQRSDKQLLDSTVCFEFGYAREPSEVKSMVSAVERIMLHGCRSARSFGSGVLDLLYVATGRLDCVYAGVASEGFKPWDFCAASVVAMETGCVIETIDGAEEFDLYSTSFICGVGKQLVGELRKTITKP